MVDKYSKEIRTKMMKAIKSKRTKIEDKVARELHKMGLRFRRNVVELKGKPDISIKKYKIVIFIDSCFWHGCEKHCRMPKSNQKFWNNKINRNKQRDQELTEFYINKNWNILRIWEHDLIENFDDTILNVYNYINKIKENN